MPHSAKNQFKPSSSLENREDNHWQKTVDKSSLNQKTLSPQQVVGNCYEVIKQLDTDRSITAYLVKDQQDQQDAFYVLELIYDGDCALETISEEIFQQQVTLIKKLSSHVQIPKLCDYLIENQQYYVIYEYTSGEMLSAIVQYRILDEAEVINLVQDAARICDLLTKSRLLQFQLLPCYILQLESTKRYILGNLRGLFLSQVTDVPLTNKQQLTLFHQQLHYLGMMVIQSLINQEQKTLSTQALPLNWQTKINLSPRLQTILAKMVAVNGREYYNSLPEIAEDFKPLLRIGQIFGGKYCLSRYLGEKNGIKTYLARNIQEKQLNSSLLIVKQLTIDNCNRKNTDIKLDYLKQEVQQLQEVPSIKVIDLVREQFEEQEELYLVRNYTEGVSLTKRLNKQKDSSSNEAINLLKKALQSLSVIHQHGLIHRNIKPSNLIVSAEDRTVALVDFGILQLLSQTNQYSQRRKPPEQIVGRPTVSSDIYSLGIVAIEILTGLSIQEIPQDLHQGKYLWQAKLASQPHLREIIQRMVCSDVEKRYQSAEYVLQDLERVQKLNVDKLDKQLINQQITEGDSGQTKAEGRSTSDLRVKPGQNKLRHSIIQPKSLLVAIAIIVGILSSLEWLFPVVRPQYQVYRGQQLLSTQPVMALNHFKVALELQPEKVSAWQGQGDALLALQKYIPALEAYEQALNISPNHVASWQGTGAVLSYLGEWQESLKAYERALSLEPSNTATLAGKGDVLSRLSRYQEALSLQEKALEDASSADVELLSNTAKNALALGKNHQALNILNRVQSIAPLKPYLWQHKVIALRNLEQPQQALESAKLVLEGYEQALEKQPQNLELWLGKGEFLQEWKRYRQALNAYRNAIAINAEDHRVWLGTAQVYLAISQYEEAKVAIEKALAIKPQSFTAWHTRGAILEQEQQDLEQAVASYDRAIALNQDFFPSWRDRSSVLIAQNDYDRAIKSLQKAVALAPQDVESWLSLSNAFLGMQKIEEARKAIDRVIFLQPRNSNYWLQKGFLWEKQQEYTKACDIYRQAMTIAPDLKITGAMQKVGCRD
jgi:eukaryotic-like serine/threonine-protein kinase